MPPLVVSVTENRSCSGVRLTPEQYEVLHASELVSSVRKQPDGTWTVTVKQGVAGAAVLGRGTGAVELRIEPKLTISRLLFLVGYARSGVAWRIDEVPVGVEPGLLPALAHVFGRMADRVLAEGVLMGYRSVEEALPVVRGRIRVAEQVRRRFGVAPPVEVGYDDHTPDIAENRILLTAALRLLALRGIGEAARSLLRRVLIRLDGVTPLPPGSSPAWQPTRLNARYHSVLELARLVLDGESCELEDGTRVRVEGLVLTMWQVYEDFVTRAVADVLRRSGARCLLQDTRFHLDRARTLPLRPDLVAERRGPDGTVRPFGVLDAKYKQDTPREDLYQVLAYCTVLDLAEGHLVYAAGSDSRNAAGADTVRRVHHLNTPGGITVYQHALDLDRPPEEVLAQIRSIAARMLGGSR